MKKVYAYIHTHWDREWYREFEEFRVRLIEVFDDVLKKLKTGELDYFYFDGQTAALEDYLEIHPEKQNEIKKLIAEKKLSTGPYYCSTDSLLIERESLIRNLQYGINYSKKTGCSDFIAYHADTFGHSKDMPAIINYFNIDYGIFWRGCGDNPSEFIFNGLKSTYLIEGYFHDELSQELDYEKKAAGLKRTLDRISKFNSDCILLPLGADHLAAADNIKQQINEINKHLFDYEIILSTPFEYFEKVQNNFKKSIKTEQRSCKRNFILPGVYSSRMDLKQKNTGTQWALTEKTEPLQALMSYLGKSRNFQKEIDNAYKTLMQNHAHDSIYGCSIDAVHRENSIRYDRVLQTANAVQKSVLRDIAGNELTVINFSQYPYSGAVKIRSKEKYKDYEPVSVKKGFPDENVYPVNKIPVTEDYCNIYEYLIDVKNLPPFSIKNIEQKDLCKKCTLQITKNSIENENIKLFIKNKKICIKDKRKNKTFEDFINITDRADIGDSYNFGALKYDKEIKAKIIKSEVKENNKIRCTLKITAEIDIPKNSTKNGRTKELRKHKLEILSSLENQSEYIDFKINWINKAENHILQVKFKFDKNIETTCSDDLVSDVVRKFDTEYDIYNHIPAPKGIELKYNTAPLKKYVMTDDAAFITEGLQEYEISKNYLCITLLRATGIISNPQNPTRGTPAGPPLLTPDLQMKGKNSARFALLFNKKNIHENTDKFFGKTFCLFAGLKDLIFIKNRNFKISAIKTDEKNNLIIRFYNPSKLKQLFDFSTELEYSKIVYLNAMEEEISDFSKKEIDSGNFVTIKIVNKK